MSNVATASLPEPVSPLAPAGATSSLGVEAMRAAHRLGRRPFSRTSTAIALGARLGDLASVSLPGLLIAFLYVGGMTAELATLYLASTVLVGFVAVAVFGSSGCYGLASLQRPVSTIGKTLGIWAGTIGVFTLVLFLFKVGETFSRAWLVGWFVAGALALALFRTLLARAIAAIRRSGRLTRRAVLVGGGEEAATLIRSLADDPRSDVEICGIFDDRVGDRVPAANQRYPLLGRIEELVEFGRLADIDLLIVALPTTAEQRLAQLLRKLWVLPIDIRLSAHSSRLKLRPRAYSFIGSVPFLDLFDKPIAGWDAIAKRVFDVTIASAAIVILSPVLLGTALAVRLDSPGPVLFRQKRYGFNNTLINVFKFRSMYTHMTDHDAARLATRGDPRITPVGRFIRKSSLDELPQLFNVLKGDLSLVGPRPHATKASAANRVYERIVDDYFARHRVKPGITGWAQVNGWRGETDTEEKIEKRVAFDLEYIENWTLLFDAYILFITPFRLFNTENAY